MRRWRLDFVVVSPVGPGVFLLVLAEGIEVERAARPQRQSHSYLALELDLWIFELEEGRLYFGEEGSAEREVYHRVPVEGVVVDSESRRSLRTVPRFLGVEEEAKRDFLVVGYSC